MTYANQFTIRPGDSLVQDSDTTECIGQFAVYLGFIDGTECFAIYDTGTGARVDTARSFFSGISGTFYIKEIADTAQERALIVERALFLQGLPHNRFLFTCQHYMQYIQYHAIESPEIKKAILWRVKDLIASYAK